MASLDRPWGPEMVAGVVVALRMLAELWHWRRIRRIAPLAFGPRRAPAAWARLRAPLLILGSGALAWGLCTLVVVEPAKHMAGGDEIIREEDLRHVVMVLDVSPSMRLEDAGPDQIQSRIHRARDVMESFFKRVPIHQYRISVIATYNGAKPVVVDTTDIEVVRNILGDLPMHFAFRSGKTKLFEGLEEAARLARPWNPGSTTLILVSDGDTVPAQGMPKMPASVAEVLVIGVGDPVTGKFIDGRQSRQDVPTLRQIAVRLGGSFHNGNERHLSSALVADLTQTGDRGAFEKLTRREYALISAAAGAAVLTLLPLLLHLLGTAWRPGVPVSGAFGASKRKKILPTAS